MQNPDPLEQYIHDLILEICTVLYNHGYQRVPMGAMMRLIGVDDQHAQNHDGQYFDLDEDFERVLEEKNSKQEKFTLMDDTVPPGVTLH